MHGRGWRGLRFGSWFEGLRVQADRDFLWIIGLAELEREMVSGLGVRFTFGSGFEDEMACLAAVGRQGTWFDPAGDRMAG